MVNFFLAAFEMGLSVRVRLEPADAIGLGVEERGLAAEQLGDELARGGGHREAEHVVAGGDEDVVAGRAAVDDRQAVLGHRPPAEPLLLDRLAVGLAQVGRCAVVGGAGAGSGRSSSS